MSRVPIIAELRTRFQQSWIRPHVTWTSSWLTYSANQCTSLQGVECIPQSTFFEPFFASNLGLPRTLPLQNPRWWTARFPDGRESLQRRWKRSLRRWWFQGHADDPQPPFVETPPKTHVQIASSQPSGKLNQPSTYAYKVARMFMPLLFYRVNGWRTNGATSSREIWPKTVPRSSPWQEMLTRSPPGGKSIINQFFLD